MTDLLKGVRSHYRSPGLTERLNTALMALWPEDHQLTPEQLGALDQFHTRGLAATAELAGLAGISTETSVLDVGSGVGGPVRFLAATYGCRGDRRRRQRVVRGGRTLSDRAHGPERAGIVRDCQRAGASL